MPVGEPPPAAESNAWRELVLRAMPGILWSTDTDLRIVACAGNFGDVLCGKESGCRGKSLSEILATEDPDHPLIAAHRRALAGETVPIGFTISGVTFFGRVAPLPYAGQIIGCIALACDQFPTDLRHQSLAQTVPDLILFLSPSGEIQEINRTGGGLQRQQLISRPIYDFVPAASHEALRQAIESVSDTGHVAQLEVQFTRRSGQSVCQSIRLGPVQLHGRTAGIVLVATDITRQRETLEKLRGEEELLRDMLELQDRERRMVAYEIHDGFLQDVVGSRMILQSVRQSLHGVDAAMIQRFDSAVSLLARAVNEGRRLISELRPMILDEMGVVDTIEYLVSEEEALGGVEVKFIHRVQQERLPPLLQSTIFRIIQESLRNARRHGAATRVEVRLTQIGTSHLILEIQDNGVGFDVDAVPGDRFGLSGIRERAQLFGGQATIESSAQHGTRITVKLAIDGFSDSSSRPACTTEAS